MINWNDNFSVNNTEIDDQHKELISIIEEVVLVVHTKDYNFIKITEIVAKLEEYIKVHLEYEENLMVKYSYPFLEFHVKDHNELRYRTQNIKVFDVNKLDEFYTDTLIYLVDWLTRHIMQVDKQLGEFLLEIDVKQCKDKE
ncbi:MAG: hemerythrin domain modulated adenylate/guanylate cyclase [Herbinix sp.]|jgi:hemerythrin|nr:hemerythrin domain modulated adenylate/guanylate cyclase [Herbinix sp.]